MLSLVLLVLAIVFWLRSVSVGDELRWHRGSRDFEAFSVNGLLAVSFGTLLSRKYPPPEGWRGSFWPFHRQTDSISGDLGHNTTLGFHYQRWQLKRPGFFGDSRGIIVPYWFLVTCFSPLPLVRLAFLLRRTRRRDENHCRSCGYNLTGNTSGVCPECGTDVADRR